MLNFFVGRSVSEDFCYLYRSANLTELEGARNILSAVNQKKKSRVKSLQLKMYNISLVEKKQWNCNSFCLLLRFSMVLYLMGLYWVTVNTVQTVKNRYIVAVSNRGADVTEVLHSLLCQESYYIFCSCK